jgi:two-component system sensor histidine kinase SenX3
MRRIHHTSDYRVQSSAYSDPVSAAEIIGVIAILALTLGTGIAIGRMPKRSSSEPAAVGGNQFAAQTAVAPLPDQAEPDSGHGELDSRLLALLEALPGMVIVVDSKGAVALASDEAIREQLVRRESLTNDEIAAAATSCLARHETIVLEVTVLRPPLRRGRLDLLISAIPISTEANPNRVNSNRDEGQVAVLLLEDLTVETRVRVARRDFIANVSHELKTPVGAMSLLAEALVAASDDKESVEHFAARLQVEAKRLTSLINDVIDLSRMQGDDPMPNPRPVEVDSLVEKTVASVSSASAAKGIEIVLSSPGRNTIVGDADQLLIALTNLLTNAIAYSDPGTRIAIAVRADDGLVEIDVKDQGIGIPEEELEHIFQRFYRVDEARSRVTGGTGLGLAIVRNVCRNHGGEVSVWSVEGEGSTFTMSLPTAESEAVAGPAGSEARAAEPMSIAAETDSAATESDTETDNGDRVNDSEHQKVPDNEERFAMPTITGNEST